MPKFSMSGWPFTICNMYTLMVIRILTHVYAVCTLTHRSGFVSSALNKC